MSEDHMLWAVNAPIPHHPSLARKQTWINTGGQTGIVGPGSLQVAPLDTPGAAVRVLPGGFVAAATPGGRAGYLSAARESYAGDVTQSRTVEIRPTGSSGPRTDVIGVMVTDPEFEGTAAQMTAAQWADHRFWDFHVIENARASASRPADFGLPRPFIPLARVTLPANRSDVRRENITDLRFMAVRRTDMQTLSYDPQSGRVIGPGVSVIGMENDYVVPQWATVAKISGWLSGAAIVEADGTNPPGNLRNIRGWAEPRITIGSLSNPSAVITLDQIRFNYRDVTRWTYISLPMNGNWVINNDAFRGQPIWLGMRINVQRGSDTFRINPESSRFDTTVFFAEEPI